jgi:hypothetical protein
VVGISLFDVSLEIAIFLNRRKIILALTALLACFAIDSGAQEGNQGNVRSFGAAGDGVADDAVALQKAVDSGAGIIYFPKGINLLIEDCSNIIVGANNFDRDPRYDYGDSRISGRLISDSRPDAESVSLKVTGGKGNMIANNGYLPLRSQILRY